mgnify:CR=1 FL=1
MGKRPVIPGTGSSDVIKIRAHHLLCMQGFQGYGYSQGFQRNLEEIINYLESNPYSSLKLVADTDVICLKCPHLEDGHCDRYSYPAIRDMDLKVLEKLDLEVGVIEPVQKLLSQVKAWNIHDLREVCGECSWKDKCLLYLSK